VWVVGVGIEGVDKKRYKGGVEGEMKEVVNKRQDAGCL